MLRTLRLIVPLAVSLALAPLAPARGEGPAVLLHDIAAGASVSAGAGAISFTPFGDKAAFLDTATGSGNAVWVSDGTGPGTRVVFLAHCEVEGICPEHPEILGAVNGFLVFSAPSREGDRGLRLWRSDGTRAGTIALTPADPAPLILHRGVGEQIVTGDKAVYFADCEPLAGCDLWGSDATPAGTRKVESYAKATGLDQMTLFGDLLFFALTEDGGRRLHVYDTRTGKDTRIASWDDPYALSASTVAGGRIFFFAPVQNGLELWTSDGTIQGTRALTQFANDDPFDVGGGWLKAIGQHVYFLADDGLYGTELWRSDGTAAGTERVSDFADANALTGLTPDGVVEAGSKVLFQANDGVTAARLWISDGRPGSTAPFHSLCPTASCPLPDAATRLVQIGGRAFLRADTGYWSTDGTWAGTHEFWEQPCPSCFVVFQSMQQKLLFAAEDAAHGRELWWSDGTAAGTRRLTDMPESVPAGDAATAGKWIFYPALGRHGNEPWVTDGQQSHLVAILEGTAPGSRPDKLTAVGNRLFFNACDGVQDSLWVSAGTPETTAQVPGTAIEGCGASQDKLAAAAGHLFFRGHADFQLYSTDGGAPVRLTSPSNLPDIGQAVDFHGKLWIPVRISGDHSSLWTSDGTPAGTGPALDDPDWGPLQGVQAVGDEIYFVNFVTFGGLWRTDGTAAGTRKIASLDPAGGFVRLGSAVFFAANGLWKTDGTAAGTVQVKSGFGSTPQELAVAQGNLFFFAVSDGQWALWRSDGTAAGTAVLARFSEVYDPPGPRFGPVALGGNLYFAANDGVHGRELWTSDGTVGGTHMLRDIEPGAGSSSPGSLVAVGGALFFSADDGVHGTELWTSDGTAAGTRMVQDIFPEAPSSQPGGLTAAGGYLYFAADDGATGREMWGLPLGGPDGCLPSPAHLCLSGGRYQVDAVWRTAEGRVGAGTAVPLSADTGYFWFFSASNVEAIVKVLDGTSLNGHVWVFYGALSNVEYMLTVTDTRTGLTRRYFNPLDQLASVGDTHAFGPLGASAASPRLPAIVAAPSPLPLISERKEKAATVPCHASAQTLCLDNDRFAVTVAWKDFQGHTGQGTAVPLSADTGTFWFFNASNIELVVKALDGRPVNGHFWLFYGALSNVEYTLTVTDTQTGTTRTYTNPSGRFASVADTLAF